MNNLFSSEKDSTPCFVGAIKKKTYEEKLQDLKDIFDEYYELKEKLKKQQGIDLIHEGADLRLLRYKLVRTINEYFKEHENE